jgi:hypothetical protein
MSAARAAGRTMRAARPRGWCRSVQMVPGAPSLTVSGRNFRVAIIFQFLQLAIARTVPAKENRRESELLSLPCAPRLPSRPARSGCFSIRRCHRTLSMSQALLHRVPTSCDFGSEVGSGRLEGAPRDIPNTRFRKSTASRERTVSCNGTQRWRTRIPRREWRPEPSF